VVYILLIMALVQSFNQLNMCLCVYRPFISICICFCVFLSVSFYMCTYVYVYPIQKIQIQFFSMFVVLILYNCTFDLCIRLKISTKTNTSSFSKFCVLWFFSESYRSAKRLKTTGDFFSRDEI
jgi:hypothetical protein